MYKLTYDSEDNEEINTPKSLNKRQKSSSDSKMKADAHETKENADGEVFSPKEKKKSVGTYEGNGRYYSLFSNDNFVTEEKNRSKKKCCHVGVKSGLLIATVIVLALAILGLMWVVRGMQVEQEGMKSRLAKLENRVSSDSASPLKSVEQPHNFGSASSDCCKSNSEQISYLDQVLHGHEERFKHVEEKIETHKRSSDVRDAQITRLIAENAADSKSAVSVATSVKHALNSMGKTVDSAKSLAMLMLQQSSLTDEQINEHLEALSAGSSKAVAFGMAHALGNQHFAANDVPEGASVDFTQQAPPLTYDVGFEVSPVLSFSEKLIDGGVYIQPESGTVTIPESGNYYLSVSFCVEARNAATIHLLKNGEILREFVVPALTTLPRGSTTAAVDIRPPPGAEGLITEDNYIPIPPLPSATADAEKQLIRPHHFANMAHLEQDDDIQLKIVHGKIAEYTYLPGTKAAKSCTRFSGFKV